MPKMIIAKRLEQGLVALGYRELTATRYVGARAFHHPDRPAWILFVGKRGSLRVGQNRSTSRVCSPRFRQEVLAAGGHL